MGLKWETVRSGLHTLLEKERTDCLVTHKHRYCPWQLETQEGQNSKLNRRQRMRPGNVQQMASQSTQKVSTFWTLDPLPLPFSKGPAVTPGVFANAASHARNMGHEIPRTLGVLLGKGQPNKNAI